MSCLLRLMCGVLFPRFDLVQIYFKTNVGKDINLLVRDYMEWFLGGAITALRPISEVSATRSDVSPSQSQQIEFKLDTVQQRAIHHAFFDEDVGDGEFTDESFVHRRGRHVRGPSVENLRGLNI